MIMKKFTLLFTLLLMCAMSFAQQALWGGAPVVSPEIHDDNTVTFRLKAPKAVKVQLTGDFLPPHTIQTPRGEYDAPGIVDMKEGKDGVWEYTTAETRTLWLCFLCGRAENNGSRQRLYDS